MPTKQTNTNPQQSIQVIDYKVPKIENSDSNKWVLHRLNTFCDSEIMRLKDLKNNTKNVNDKIALYQLTQRSIQKEMVQDPIRPLAVKKIVNLIAQIAHHRRYRTCNKALNFFKAIIGQGMIEATSWKNFQQLVAEFSSDSSQAAKDLRSSLNERLVTLGGEIINGYEDFRDYYNKPK